MAYEQAGKYRVLWTKQGLTASLEIKFKRRFCIQVFLTFLFCSVGLEMNTTRVHQKRHRQ